MGMDGDEVANSSVELLVGTANDVVVGEIEAYLAPTFCWEIYRGR